MFRPLLALAVVCAVPLSAANPLNLTPGVAATVTLGSLQTPANFNTSTASADITYSNTDLASRQYVVRLPSGFDPNNATKKYGLITYIDAGTPHSFPASYAAALDARDIIWIAGNAIDNTVAVNTRRGVAIMGAFRMSELYNIDSNRIYISGLSGGGRIGCDLGYLRSDYFRGFLGRVGSSLPARIPGWQVAGTNSTAGNYDADYELMSTGTTVSSVVLPTYFRTALMSQYSDFRRAENLGIYRFGHLNHGNTARMVLRPGGHSDEVGDSFTDAVNFLYHPLVDVIWDRFEDGKLGANTETGNKTVAGTGFAVVSGNVTEGNITYNSSSIGVLRLSGDRAAARSYDTFDWKSVTGILVDARLRAETAAGVNQRIGLHIIPSSAPAASAATQAGFHLYWGYGEPDRAEIVGADGTRKTLATWEHTATHPMNLPLTVTSPQAGEGNVTEKTFWDSTAAPDYAGRTRIFRGEDVRLVLNSVGFQLTFNRPAVNIVTDYANKVVAATADTVSTDPNESAPYVLQGFWAEVETALVNALPSGSWQVVLTNDAVNAAQPTGDAFVDEIRLVGSSGLQAAPVVTVSAPANTTRTISWTRIHGALGYVVERSDAPDGPFTAISTLAPAVATLSDNVTQNVAYYYWVRAVGSDGQSGTRSLLAFAARNVAVPAAPGSAAVSYPASYQVRVSWVDNSNNETGFRVERSPAGREQWSTVSGVLTANATSYLDTGVAAGAAYDYRISAVGTGGLSTFASVSATVPDVAPPVPAGLAGNATFTSVSLTWTAVPEASTYRVKRSSSAGGPFTTIASGLTSPAYLDATAAPGTTYFYVVSSVGATLESADSAAVSLTTSSLSAPVDLVVTPGFTTNTLTWTALSGTDGYTVRRALSPTGPFTVVASGLQTGTFTDTGLVTGTTYYYQVVATSGGYESTAAPASAVPVAGTVTKLNNTNALDSGSSWSTGVVPTIADTALWNGTYTTGAVAIGAGMSAAGIQLTSPSQAITINAGTGSLTLGSGGFDLSIATQNLTVNAAVALASPQTWTVAAGRTLTLASSVSTAVSPAPALALSGNGTVSFNTAGDFSPFPGRLGSDGTSLRVNQASGNLTLNSSNLPAGSNATFTTITGAAGSRITIDAAPTANISFAGNTVGFTVVLLGGKVTYNAVSGNTDATNVRVEGGTFAITPTAARYQLAAANQTFQLIGGTVDVSRVTSFGFRVGGSGSATQPGAQNVAASQSGGTLLGTFCTIGGNDTTSSRSPSYTLSGGAFVLSSNPTNALQLGADPAGSGNSTFAFSGGRLFVPGTLSGAQAGARQIFSMTGGTLAAATVNFTNLRSSDASSPGTFAQSGGTLAPGDAGAAGRCAITGNYSLGGNATLAIDLGGTTQAAGFQTGQYDLVTVSGTAALSGALRVSLLGGFTPSANTTFTVLSSTGVLSGAFSNAAFGSRILTAGGEGSFVVTQSGNTVQLSQYLNALQTWRLANFGTSANSGNAADSADPDGDGVPNLMEYALGSDPNSSLSAGRAIASLTSDGLRVTLSFLRARSDLTYIVEGSADLASWSVVATNPGAPGQNVVVVDNVNVSTATPPRRFLRLRVTSP